MQEDDFIFSNSRIYYLQDNRFVCDKKAKNVEIFLERKNFLNEIPNFILVYICVE